MVQDGTFGQGMEAKYRQRHGRRNRTDVYQRYPRCIGSRELRSPQWQKSESYILNMQGFVHDKKPMIPETDMAKPLVISLNFSRRLRLAETNPEPAVLMNPAFACLFVIYFKTSDGKRTPTSA